MSVCTVRLMPACNKPLPVIYVPALTLVHPYLVKLLSGHVDKSCMLNLQVRQGLNAAQIMS